MRKAMGDAAVAALLLLLFSCYLFATGSQVNGGVSTVSITSPPATERADFTPNADGSYSITHSFTHPLIFFYVKDDLWLEYDQIPIQKSIAPKKEKPLTSNAFRGIMVLSYSHIRSFTHSFTRVFFHSIT